MPRKKKAAPPPKPKKPRVRDKRRVKPAPVPSGPLVPMPMPWVKPESGVTVSYVCPMCRARREVSPAEAKRLISYRHVPLDELACSHDCRERWLHMLMVAIHRTRQEHVLEDHAWVWELNQGVVAEVLAYPLQEAAQPLLKNRSILCGGKNYHGASAARVSTVSFSS